MKTLYSSALLGLLLLTLGCEAPIEFPDEHLKLPDLSFEGQKQFCQALKSEADLSLDVYKKCTYSSIPDEPAKDPFSWKTKKELEALCKTPRSEWTEKHVKYLSEPCRKGFIFRTSKAYYQKDPDALRGKCEAKRMECEDENAQEMEEFYFSKGDSCGFPWDIGWLCDVTVKQARECLEAVQNEESAVYSDLELSCEPDSWKKAWERKKKVAKDLKKKEEEEKKDKEEGKKPKLPSACKALEECYW